MLHKFSRLKAKMMRQHSYKSSGIFAIVPLDRMASMAKLHILFSATIFSVAYLIHWATAAKLGK